MKIVTRILLALVAVICLSYLADLALLRWKYSRGDKRVFGTVVVRRYFAVPRKDRRTEYIDDDPRQETCVNALFPHASAPPCWYLDRHRERRIDR